MECFVAKGQTSPFPGRSSAPCQSAHSSKQIEIKGLIWQKVQHFRCIFNPPNLPLPIYLQSALPPTSTTKNIEWLSTQGCYALIQLTWSLEVDVSAGVPPPPSVSVSFEEWLPLLLLLLEDPPPVGPIRLSTVVRNTSPWNSPNITVSKNTCNRSQ